MKPCHYRLSLLLHLKKNRVSIIQKILPSLYSTVTDFAKFRGLSTSQPLPTDT